MQIRFGPFTLDGRARQLLRGTRSVHLSPKAFDLLALLIDRHPAAVSKTEIHRLLWPDTFVSDINLAVLIAEIRTALGDHARNARFIRTVHRFGYAFSGAIVTGGRRGASLQEAGVCWIMWRNERVPLSPGDNLLGRDPDASVRVDAVGVSRRHAMIVVEAGDVILRDLASKNGTYVGDVRISSPTVLADNAEIRLGPALMRFYRRSDIPSTETLSSGRLRKLR